MGSSDADLGIFISSLVVIVSYNVYYFSHTVFPKHRLRIGGTEFVNLYAVGRLSRELWANAMMDDAKEGIVGVQAVRNMVIAVSILAAAVATLTSTLFTTLVDPGRLAGIQRLAENDPINAATGTAGAIEPEAKVGLALGIMLLALVAMAQTVRLAVHLGYMLRVVPINPVRFRLLRREALTINRRTSLFFAVSLRLLFSAVPLIMYVLGPTALLVTTVVEVVSLFFMDNVRVPNAEANYAAELQEELASSDWEAGGGAAVAAADAAAGRPALVGVARGDGSGDGVRRRQHETLALGAGEEHF